MKIDESLFKDLSGDHVYDMLKKHFVAECLLLGAMIEERKKVRPDEARKVIHALVRVPVKGKVIFSYNYNKFAKRYSE